MLFNFGFGLQQPLWGLLLIPAIAGIIWAWRTGRHAYSTRREYTIVGLRVLLAALLILALSGLTWRQSAEDLSVIVAGDLSASAAAARPANTSWIQQALAARPGNDRLGLVAVGGQALAERPASQDPFFGGWQSVPNVDQTDLASGLRLAAALLPPDTRHRIVLLTDGRETTGDAITQAELLRKQGIRVDVAPLTTPAGPESLVEKLQVPGRVHQGERVSIVVRTVSSVPNKGVLRLYMDTALVAEQPIQMSGRADDWSFSIDAPAPGFHSLRAVLDADSDTLLQNNEAAGFIVVEGPPKVLVVEGLVDGATNVTNALKATGVDVEVRPPPILPLADLERYAAVVLVDVSADEMGKTGMETLRAYVRDLGRGLVVIGGSQSYALGRYEGTPLEEALPVSAKVPIKKERGRAALVLVIDHSGTMGEPGIDGVQKMAMARNAASLALESLDQNDLAGVVMFDDGWQWLVPLKSIGDNGGIAEIQKRISTIQEGGGTDIYPALEAGIDGVIKADAKVKHVILLTDGISPAGPYDALLERGRQAGVTVSTIAVGNDADQNLLSTLARLGQGRYYFVDHAADLPRYVTTETQLAIRPATVDEQTVPRITGSSPILRALPDSVPTLGGYIITTPKGAAQIILTSDKGDPLLAQWQYGLGRVVAWTPDSRGRWTAGWLAQSWWSQFISGMVGWTLPAEEGKLQLEASASAGTGRIAVELDTAALGGLEATTNTTISASVVSPDLSAHKVMLEATAPGRFEGSFEVPQRGSYLIQVNALRGDQVIGRTSGGLVVPYSPEYLKSGVDTAFLQRLAQAGGGAILSSPDEVWQNNVPPVYTETPLAGLLLTLAVLLLPFDIAFRRLTVQTAAVRSAAERVSERLRPARKPSLPDPVLSRLQQRKQSLQRPTQTIDVPPEASPTSQAPASKPSPPPKPATPSSLNTEQLLAAKKKRNRG